MPRTPSPAAVDSKRAFPNLDSFRTLESFRWTGPEAEHPQVARLEAVVRAAVAATAEARRGNLFASRAGRELVNAMFELTEIDALYDLADDVAAEMGDPDWRERA